MSHPDPRTELAAAVDAYTRALLNGTRRAYTEATWRLYQAHAAPFGETGRAMLLWLRHETWTTAN